jgi:hypothetical protein
MIILIYDINYYYSVNGTAYNESVSYYIIVKNERKFINEFMIILVHKLVKLKIHYLNLIKK